jgi:hypothetical protein
MQSKGETMTAKQIQDLTLLLIALLLAFGAWVIIDHPEWLMWIFTYKG